MIKINTSLLLGLLLSFSSFSQTVSSKLKFEQGQTLEITLQLKTTIAQQAMGQAIDFVVEATGAHAYKVTNATEENTTLSHQLNHITFLFDGMGQKMNFDSKKEKDLNGQMGKSIKELLDKKYNIIIDPNGKTMMAMPEKISMGETDSRMAIITSMLKDITDLVQPPQKGKASFFNILPEGEHSKGHTWTTTEEINGGKTDAAYVISEINDSTIIVDFVEKSTTIIKAEMMGSETTTTMNNQSTGKIILNKATGIMQGKTYTTESNGNTEAPFGTMPVTSKTTTEIRVKSISQ